MEDAERFGARVAPWILAAVVAGFLAVSSAKHSWIGLDKDLVNILLTVVGVVVVLYQLRETTRQLTQERSVEVVRLITEWMEAPSARLEREAIYTSEFLIGLGAGEVGLLQVHNPVSAWSDVLRRKPAYRIAENVAAQMDRLGAYLRGTSGQAQEAALRMYAPAIARSWALTMVYVRVLRAIRSPAYGANFQWLAERALEVLRERGEEQLRFHLTETPNVIHQISTADVQAWPSTPLPEEEANRMIRAAFS